MRAPRRRPANPRPSRPAPDRCGASRQERDLGWAHTQPVSEHLACLVQQGSCRAPLGVQPSRVGPACVHGRHQGFPGGRQHRCARCVEKNSGSTRPQIGVGVWRHAPTLSLPIAQVWDSISGVGLVLITGRCAPCLGTIKFPFA